MDSGPVNFESRPPEPFAEPTPGLNRLTDTVRSLEQWYAADFERRVNGLTEVLKSQISEELRAQYAAELNAQVERVQKQYEERMTTQSRQWDQQRDSMEKEIAELRKKVPNNDVITEIAATEAIMTVSADRSARELERVAPDAASLGRVLQARIEELETRAYLRGLKFRLPENM
ncbi:MAG TPA: hypothetical protein VFR18_27850 [Terriglobia bacterium]|nr:hypothetical protein [Terriglobia bacterium]